MSNKIDEISEVNVKYVYRFYANSLCSFTNDGLYKVRKFSKRLDMGQLSRLEDKYSWESGYRITSRLHIEIK